MFRIALTGPKGQTNEVECTIDQCTIGKGDDNLVVIRGWSVGKKHATIRQRPDGFYIEDHGGMGGTEVNGKNIDGNYGPIKADDSIMIGGYNIKVVTANGGQAPAAHIVQQAAAAQPPKAAVPAAVTLAGKPGQHAVPEPQAAGPSLQAIKEINEARNRVHQKLIQMMDLKRLDVSRMGEKELRETTRQMIDEVIAADKSIPGHMDKAKIAKAVLDEVVGLGPLEDLLADPTVTEIMVNRYDQIYVERKGKLTLSEITFSGEKAVVGAIERIVAPLGRRIDESSPMVDGRLKDGSRVNAVIPPLALKGANITIRKFSKNK